MKPFSTISCAVTLATAALALAAPFAFSQEFPARAIHALCTYGPGSGADVIVRFYSDRLSKLTGKPVIVENKVGANGAMRPTLWRNRSLTADPDYAGEFNDRVRALHVQNLPSIHPDFTAVTTIAALVHDPGHAASPIRTVDELIAHLKAKSNNGHGTTNNTGAIA
jgi:tripartite-type tricarboxylate transporter receptor subunit TctC